jgi:hypothetical protein
MVTVTRYLAAFCILLLAGSAYAQELPGPRVFNNDVAAESHNLTFGAGLTADVDGAPPEILDDPEWIIRADSLQWFANDNAMRSGTYNPATDHLLIASRTGGARIVILHPANGHVIGELDLTGVSGGTFPINEIAVTEDGQIFVANLVTSDDASVRIYRWANESATPVLIHDAPLAGPRYGDALAVSGSGSDVRVYVSGGSNDRIARLAWDGTTLSAPTYIVPEPGVAVARLGIAHSRGEDSLWVNQPGGTLMKIGMDGGIGRQIPDAVLPEAFGDMDFFEWNERYYILTGPYWNDDHRFVLLDVTDPGEERIVFETMRLGDNPNANAVGFATTDWKRGNLVVGATNNAIASFSVADHPNTPPTASQILTPEDGAEIRIEGDPETEFTVTWTQATDPQGDTVLYYWQLSTVPNFSSALATVNVGTNRSYTTTYADIDALLVQHGVAFEGTLTAYHRIISTDGALGTAGPSRTVTLIRGALTSTEDPGEIPADFALHGNYPNPFNPTTNIRFDLPQSADVRVEVYDILGRRVMALTQSLQAGSNQTITLDAHNLSSGTYLYRVVAEMPGTTRIETGKMLLVK